MGDEVGDEEGVEVVGENVGVAVGDNVGVEVVGEFVGDNVGVEVVGEFVGYRVGATEGTLEDGEPEGGTVGDKVRSATGKHLSF